MRKRAPSFTRHPIWPALLSTMGWLLMLLVSAGLGASWVIGEAGGDPRPLAGPLLTLAISAVGVLVFAFLDPGNRRYRIVERLTVAQADDLESVAAPEALEFKR